MLNDLSDLFMFTIYRVVYEKMKGKCIITQNSFMNNSHLAVLKLN